MLEFLEQIEEEYRTPLDAIVMPSAGGGLLAGVGIVCKDLPIEVYGTEPAKGGANLRIARREGQPVTTSSSFPTIADGLRAPTSQFNWELLVQSRLIDAVYAATDAEIKIAMQLILEETKMVVEPSAAVPLAVILFNKDFRANLASRKKDWTIGVILSGGNTTLEKMVERLYKAPLDCGAQINLIS